jgi:ABC-type sugar transport system substrate-binding protein
VATYFQKWFKTTLTQNMFSTIKGGDYYLHAFAVAAANPLSDAQQATLYSCLKTSTCKMGSGKISIGYAESFGGVPLNQAFRMEATAQALIYPQVGTFIYLDANASLSTYISNIRSLISQKVNAIIVNDDFGAAALPVIRQAQQAGIAVILLQPLPGAVAGVDYTTQVASSNACAAWTSQAKLAVQQLGKNKTYALLSGTPGDPYDATWQPCAKNVLSAAGWTDVFNANTNFTPQGEEQAANALLASGKKPDAILYAASGEYILQPYIDQKQTPPVWIGASSNAAMWALYQKADSEGINFPAYIAVAGAWELRPAVTAAVEKSLGMSIPDDVTQPFSTVNLKDVAGLYDPAYPAGTQMVPDVPPAWLQKALSS